MDYYERKRRAQILVRDLLSKKVSDDVIAFNVEGTYQLSKKWALNYIEDLKEQ